MLHGLKKTVHKTGAAMGVSAATEPDNAEFADLKQRIANVVKTLGESSAQLDKIEGTWKALLDEQRKKAENFANLYPDDDELKKQAKQVVEITDVIRSKTSPGSATQTNYDAINAKVKTYLAEYKTLESEYSKLTEAKTEYELYKKKMDDLESARKPDEERIARNTTKYDEVRTAYNRQLDAVIERQKEFYGKRKEMFKASFVAYWLANGFYIDLLSDKFKPVIEYSEQNEKVMLDLDVLHMKGGN